MAKLWGLILAIAGLGLSLGGQQPVLPQGIIPVPDKPGIVVALKTDKGVYAPGDRLQITFTLPRAAYVYLWNITSAGKAQLLLPNRFLQTPFFPAGTHVLPQAGWVLRVTEPEGMEYLQILVVDRPLSFYEAKAWEKQSFVVFASPGQLAAAVQGSLGDAVWGTAWTSYLVYKPKGTVSVVTVPAGAEVWIDGKFVGETPVRLVVPAGKLSVRVEKAGYEDRRLTVDLGDGEEVQLVVALERARPLPWFPPGLGEPVAETFGVGFNVGWISALSGGFDLWLDPVGLGLSLTAPPPRPDLSQPGPGGWFAWGPEIEGYVALWFQGTNLGVWGSVGLSFQEMAYVPSWYPMARPLVEVEPETDWEIRLTWSLGVGTGGEGWRAYVAWHNRRGVVVGFAVGP